MWWIKMKIYGYQCIICGAVTRRGPGLKKVAKRWHGKKVNTFLHCDHKMEPIDKEAYKLGASNGCEKI
jgi:hypothetical protein